MKLKYDITINNRTPPQLSFSYYFCYFYSFIIIIFFCGI